MVLSGSRPPLNFPVSARRSEGACIGNLSVSAFVSAHFSCDHQRRLDEASCDFSLRLCEEIHRQPFPNMPPAGLAFVLETWKRRFVPHRWFHWPQMFRLCVCELLGLLGGFGAPAKPRMASDPNSALLLAVLSWWGALSQQSRPLQVLETRMLPLILVESHSQPPTAPQHHALHHKNQPLHVFVAWLGLSVPPPCIEPRLVMGEAHAQLPLAQPRAYLAQANLEQFLQGAC